jgi:hypothetical protein
MPGEQLILEVVWQVVHKARTDTERWASCQEMDDCVQVEMPGLMPVVVGPVFEECSKAKQVDLFRVV